ncbi:MAG: alpha/beta hydrolase [Rhodospirillaceae bacterium]|nr:alpha/beta hydrolase [Rhodospirillaceae bacterium]
MRKVVTGVVLLVAIIAAGLLYVRSGALDTDPAEAMARYGGSPSQFVVIDGTRVHYRDEGAGPVLVLMHGSRASLHQWDGWVAALRDRFRIIRFDSLAHGLTGPDAKGDYSSARQLFLLTALLDQLHVDRFMIGATSSGATEAVRFAAQNPQRVEKMVLSTVPLKLPAANKISRFNSAIFWLHDNVLGTTATNLYWRAFLQGIFADPSRVTEEMVERYRILNSRTGQTAEHRQRIVTWQTGGGAARDFEIAGGVTAPILIQWGLAGPVLPPELHCQIAEAFTHADVRVIMYPDLGHKLVLEDPVTTARDAAAFLLENTGGVRCGAAQ